MRNRWAVATWASSPIQISKAGCWMAREKEKDRAQGSFDLNRAFMAFNRPEASSGDWPPERKVIPGTAAGTDRKRHLTVVSATSSTGSWRGQDHPGSTMLGFRRMPSKATLWA